MTDDSKTLISELSDLDDLEFEIVFIDSICKKLKQVYEKNMKSASLLFVYYSIVESFKKYKEIATEANRSIPHKDIIDALISKGDTFLSSVADDEDKSMYAFKSLESVYETVKDLMLALKVELVKLPKYEHLKSD